MVTTAEERLALKRAVQRIKDGGALPEEARAAVAQQFLDAIGTLHASGEQMGAQLEKSRANLKATLGDVERQTKELADLVDVDRASLASAKGGWEEHGLQVPASVSGIGLSELARASRGFGIT